MRRHLLLAMLALIVCNGQVVRAGADESLEELRKEKVKVAEEWLKSISESYRGGLLPQLELLTAARALMDARFEAAKTKRERVLAREAYHDALSKLHSNVKTLSEANALGGEAYRFSEAKYRMLEAQVWLLEEKAKP